MITRKIGKIIRGQATPYQVCSAAVLGATLAFLPAFDRAAGLYVLLFGTLLVLNANLGVAMLVGVPAKLLALAATPISFAIGRALLDGPVGPVFGFLINAPVTAYLGLEYYVTTGGLVLGLAFGGTTGWMLVTVLQYLRATFAELERNSDGYWELMERRWVRIVSFVFLGGGRGKKKFDELVRKQVGLSVRPLGLVAIGAFVAFALSFQSLLASSFLANALQGTLERTNGATVDVSGLALELSRGHLTIDGLAMANRDDLDRDVFRAAKFEADISTTDLLRKRFTIERLLISQATSGEPRAVRGELVGSAPTVAPEPVEAPSEDALSVGQVFEDGRLWQARLTTAQRWIECLAPESPAEQDEAEETLRERLEQRAREFGYADLRAAHLIEDHPRFLIQDVIVDGLAIACMEGETFEVRARNLTTQPHLLAESSSVEFVAHSGNLRAMLAGDGAHLEVNALSVDAITGSLQVRGERPVAGGTLDLELDAAWSHGRAGYLEVPLRVTLHDSLLTLPGHGSTVVDRFELPVLLSGPLSDLSIRVEDEALTSALVEAGQEELARRVRERADEELAGLEQVLSDELAAEMSERDIDTEEIEAELEKKAGGLLRGLLDGR